MSEFPQFPGCACHDLIAEGSCGAVYAATWEEETPAAVKVFKAESINSEYVKHCLEKLRSADPHPGILPVFDHDLDGSPAYCVMALRLDYRQDPPEPRSLEAQCGQLPAAEAWQLIEQLADAMAHAHQLGVVHCGLKTSNVFTVADDGIRVEVSDFGQGWLGGVRRLTLSDHTFYASPEQLAHPEQLFEKDVRIWDVYAFGVVAYRLLTGFFPRFEEELEALRQRIEEDPEAPIIFNPAEYAANAANYPEIFWPEAFGPAQADPCKVIERCLALDPQDRFPEMGSVRAALRAAVPDTAGESVASHGDGDGDGDGDGRDGDGRDGRDGREESGSLAAPVYARMPPSVVSPEESQPAVEDSPGVAGRMLRLLPWMLAACLAVAVAYISMQHADARKSLASLTAELEASRGQLEQFSGALADRAAEEQQAASLVAESTLEAGAAREEKLRAQRNLAKAQDTADYFFSEFIDGVSDKADTPERRIAFERAERFYQSVLESSAEDPELLDSVARATLNLALIQNALGKTGEAESGYSRAIDFITQLIEKDPGSPTADDHRLRLARARHSAAKLRLEKGDFEKGLELLEMASEEFRPFAARLASDSRLRHTVAEVYQLTGWVFRQLERPDEAISQQGRTVELLSAVEEEPNNAPKDALLLSKAYFERGRCRLLKGEHDEGANDHVKAVDMLLELHELDPEAPAYRFQLGINYWALGEMLMESGIWNQAGQAHSEAVKYLKSLVEQFPGVSDYKMALALDYAAVARLLRDQGSPERALDYQRGTVVFINEVVSKAGASDLDRHELALNRGLYAELLATADKVPEAINEAREAVTMAEEIKIKQAAGSHLRKRFHISLAQLYATLGDVFEKEGNKDEAITSFKKAVGEWQQLAAAGHEDDVIRKGLEWCKERLSALDPAALEAPEGGAGTNGAADAA